MTGLPDAVIQDLSKSKKFKYVAMRPSKILNGTVFCNPTEDYPLNLGYSELKITKSGLNNLILNIKNSVYDSPQYMEIAKKNLIFLNSVEYLR